MSMKWHKKTDIAFFVKKIENRRVKMSESAVKRAISGSVAGDEEQPPGSAGTGDDPRGDQVGIARGRGKRRGNCPREGQFSSVIAAAFMVKLEDGAGRGP